MFTIHNMSVPHKWGSPNLKEISAHVMFGLIEHNQEVVLCYGGLQTKSIEEINLHVAFYFKVILLNEWEASTFLCNIILSLI